MRKATTWIVFSNPQVSFLHGMVTSTNVVSKAGPGSVLSSTVLSGSACLVSAQAGSLLRIVSLLLETLAADNEVFAAQGSLAHAAALVGDPAFLYKFMFKAKADEAATLKALLQNLRWRLAGTGSDSDSTIKFEGVKSLSKKALEYLHMGIFRFHGQDRQGRPTLLINMSKYNAATGKNSIPQFKECLIFVLEVGRRCIYAVNDALVKANSTMAAIDHSLDSVVAVSKNEDWAVDVGASPRLIHQLSVIVDLDGVGLANVNYEMMPILLGLFKTHYPATFFGRPASTCPVCQD
ncbi:hypothetical protein BC830DRAFT_59388 [Chytriomyces sp. MP71]|nr:hypothetical protein BC830DRAFT_59388 [Chytriomyces sp. MP71]